MSDEELETTLVQYLKQRATEEPACVTFVEGGEYTSDAMFAASARGMITAARTKDSIEGVQHLKRQMRQWLRQQA